MSSLTAKILENLTKTWYVAKFISENLKNKVTDLGKEDDNY